jgi:hypothetical protein
MAFPAGDEQSGRGETPLPAGDEHSGKCEMPVTAGGESTRGRWWRVTAGTMKFLGGAIATVAAVVGILVALGVIHQSSDIGTSVAQAAVKTIDTGSSRVTITFAEPLPDGTQRVLFKANGLFDYRLDQGRVNYDYSQLAASVPRAVPGGQTIVEAIIDGDLIFFKLPRPVGGKTWREIDLVALYKKALGVDIGPLFAYNSDPKSSLENLRAIGKITRVDREQLLDGSMGTHYRGLIDLHKVGAIAPANIRAGLSRAVDALVAAGLSPEVPVEVWIGDDGIVRRVDESVSAGGMQFSVRIDLFAFGVNVDATPPPADQVLVPSL